MRCIWCTENSEKKGTAVEHIIPEVLGCPDDFILTAGEVCAMCNNNLAHLDSTAADSFDFSRLFAGQRGKSGKWPNITSRSNVSTSWQKDELIIEANFGTTKVKTEAGRTLTPAINKLAGVKGSFKIHGPVGRASFKVPVAHHPKLPRALHKIALTSLVKIKSHEHVMQTYYDPVRRYVLDGIGKRVVLLGPAPADGYQYQHHIELILHKSGYCDLGIELCGFNFYVDLSPTQEVIPKLKQAMRSMYGDKGWTWLPVK